MRGWCTVSATANDRITQFCRFRIFIIIKILTLLEYTTLVIYLKKKTIL